MGERRLVLVRKGKKSIRIGSQKGAGANVDKLPELSLGSYLHKRTWPETHFFKVQIQPEI